MISDEDLVLAYDHGGERETGVVTSQLLDALLLVLSVQGVHVDDLAVDVVLDVVTAGLMREQDVAAERSVVLEEIAMQPK